MDARTLCLGVINDAPATGYDIKKAVEAGPFQHFFGISYGSIYPTLNRLLDDGEVTIKQDTDDGEGGHPSKRRFEITDLGRAEFQKQLANFDTKDRFRSEFVLAMFYFDELTPADQTAILTKRISHLESELDDISAQETAACAEPGCPHAGPGRQKLMSFARTLRGAELTFLSEYRDEISGRLRENNQNAAGSTGSTLSDRSVQPSQLRAVPAEAAAVALETL